MSKFVMRRLRLPAAQAPKLLRLLSHRGIDAGAIYPGHQGVASAVREELYWDSNNREVWGGE